VLRACLVALSPLFLLFQAGCADLWGFDDLTLASEAGSSDGAAPGRDAGPEASGNPDATEGDDGGPGDGGSPEGSPACPNDLLNCGACGNVCDNTRSLGATCQQSSAGVWACHYTGCAAGLEDCDQSGANTNGCETSMTSTSSCGACGFVCDTASSIGASCVTGPGGAPMCQYTGCMPGFADCNPSAPNTDGCETKTNTATNCGGCGVTCDTTHSQSPSCPDGKTCQYTGCSPGYVDCKSDPPDTDGCESMAQSMTCSACGDACDTTQSNFTACNTTGNPVCEYSSCKAGFKDCNATPPDTNGCETPIASATNCGDCGVTCDVKNSKGATCSGTSCSYTGCAAGFADCFPQPPNTNGCESSLSSTTSCGACGNSCNTKTGAAKCNGSTCSYTCNAGSSDCNAATAPDTDGCECPTPGCCAGAKCQTTHANGVGAAYYDCIAKGTYTAAEATEACEASAGSGHCTGSSKCCALSALGLCVGATASSVCGIVGAACYCWQYGGNLPGTVQRESPSACTATCGASGDPGWN